MKQPSLLPFTSLALLATLFGTLQARGNTMREQRFTLREPLGQAWTNDLVSFDLPQGTPADAERFTLLGPDGKPRPFQLHTRGTAAAVSFLASLPARGEATWRLINQPSAAVRNPFAIERNGAAIRVSNGITGIEVPGEGGDFANGPIRCVRLASGRWVGGSRLVDTPAIEGYEVEVTASGPVFTEIESRYRFAGGAEWVLSMRVIAGEPVILIRETFQVAPAAAWELVFGGEWTPDNVTMMPGTGPAPYQTIPMAFDDSVTATIGPWIQWWDARQGLVCALSSGQDGAAGGDRLAVAAGDVAAWARSEPGAYDNAPRRFLRIRGREEGSVAVRLPLIGPGRYWMLASDAVVESPAAEGGVASFHKLMNRYMETPLDKLKEMPLRWRRGDVAHPLLGVGRERLVSLLQTAPMDALLAQSADPPSQSVKRALWPLILAGRAEELPAAARDFTSRVLGTLDSIVAVFRYGNRGYPAAMYGTLIPRVDLVQLLPSLDLALAAGVFPPEEHDRVFAQLAFVALKLASPDYVSPGRSLAGNPNMVTAWSTSLVLLAAMMPDHPEAQAWYREGMGRLDNMLENWQGPKGGWLEAPHYQVAALDPILFAKLAAANSGLLPDARDERLLRTSLFLAKISTPPNPGFGNLRHFPPLGNTYRKETSMLFGAIAALHAESSPEAAAGLQWMWRQQGQPRWGGLGGISYMNAYAEELLRPEWNAPAPDWQSELFPGFGAVLRGGFPGPRETYMVYHQGDVATAHYDDDQGSFEMWGKGRPLCLDWGYRGHMAAALHNRMSVGNAGKIVSFLAEPAADYILGRQGLWTRQILLVKDPDPLGPNYFVLRDTVDGEGVADWRLWVSTRLEGEPVPIPASGILQRPLTRAQLPPAVAVDGKVIRFTGVHDVDLDVWHASPGRTPVDDVQFEHAAVLTVGGYVGGGWSGWDEDRLDQIGIKVSQPAGAPLTSVLYPRLREHETAPTFHALAEGRAVRVEGPWGTDYVFLSREPFDFEEGDIRFQGTAGVIQRRGERAILTLCADGRIADGDVAATRRSPQAGTSPSRPHPHPQVGTF